MSSDTRPDEYVTPLHLLLRRAAIPATASVVVDLESRSQVAILVRSSDAGEPMDAVTITRSLITLAASTGRPVGPMIFDVPVGTLISVPAAGQYGEHPMILSMSAEGMLEHPAESLRLIERARELGWEIGLSDVGSSPATLAAVAAYEPCLITLSERILADPTSPIGIETLHALTALRHATGATVMAEGLGGAAVRHTAQSLGATIGSGRGVPPLAADLPPELDYTLDLFISPQLPDHTKSPFELCVQRHQSQRCYRPLLTSLSSTIESHARTAGSSTIVLASFQHGRHITPRVAAGYEALAERVEMTVMVAPGLKGPPVPGVTWAELPRHDALRREWIVLALGPTSAMLLAAREVRPSERHADREFRYVLSYDRDLVAHAARSVLIRLTRRTPRRSLRQWRRRDG